MSGSTPDDGDRRPGTELQPGAELDDGIEREEMPSPAGSGGESSAVAGADARQLPLVLGQGQSPGAPDDGDRPSASPPEDSAPPDDLGLGGMWGVDIDIDGAAPSATARAARVGGSALSPGTTTSGDPRRADAREDDGEHDGEIPIITIDYDAPFADVLEPAARGPDEQATPTIIAIAAGRGGAGKSLLAANMAVYLAQVGKRVVAVDADPAGGTLNHLLGTPRPGRGFGSFLRGRAETLDELAVDTPVAGVRLIAGETLAFGSPRPRSNGKAVLAALRGISADIIVVDLGPPDSALCLDLWLGAQTSILVTLADPASIEATYRFVKSAFLRRLRGERGLDKLQAQLGVGAGRPLPAALDLYRVALDVARSVRDEDTGNSATAGDPGRSSGPPGGNGSSRGQAKIPAAAVTLAQVMARFRPRFVVAQTRSLGDTKLGLQMAMAAHRRLGHVFDYLGHVESDETVAAASRRHRPVMAEFPEAKVCRNIEKIVRRILSTETERPSSAMPPRLEGEQTFYEILETEPGVSDEEIRRAFRACKEIYAVGSPVVSGLYDESELAALHERANAAHDTLFAPERRRLYDLSLPEADLARAVRRASQVPRLDAAATARPDASGPVAMTAALDKATEITGAVLRKLRESRGLELSEVAQRTKISQRHLSSIEEERFDELPAPVYIRGFVSQIARIVGVDPSRAADTYMRRFHGALGPGAGTPVLKEL